jgi:oxygen-independent coproporphyrinogen-3 oxidase
MAGIYFHIPFCKQACHYCDFHFTTSLQYKTPMVEALLKEIDLRASFLEGETIETIYFGGGTPSLLEADQIQQLIDGVAHYFSIAPKAEITLEANPDDLQRERLTALKNTSINRFSVGIQSFFEEDLRWMNRAHSSEEARQVIPRVQDAGFENITADLIYGYPLLSDAKWEANIQTLCEFKIPHLSAYSMTVESKTALDTLINKGKTPPMDEHQSAHQFERLMESLHVAGYTHYEISNWAIEGMEARHNSNYWKGVPYLGIGPSAHSYRPHLRQWNIAHNARYMKGINDGICAIEEETLSAQEQLHEYIMTSLRTKKGIDLGYLASQFGFSVSDSTFQKAMKHVEAGLMERDGDHLRLTRRGKLLADYLTTELFD